jgi:hypothetical protein
MNSYLSTEEVDRIYLSTTDTLAVDDVAGSRSVRITKKNLPTRWCGTLGSKRVKPPATWATRYVYF